MILAFAIRTFGQLGLTFPRIMLSCTIFAGGAFRAAGLSRVPVPLAVETLREISVRFHTALG